MSQAAVILLTTSCHHVSKPQQAPRLPRPSFHSQPELRAFHVDVDCPLWAAKDVGDGTVSTYTAGRAAVLGPGHTAGSLRELWTRLAPRRHHRAASPERWGGAWAAYRPGSR